MLKVTPSRPSRRMTRPESSAMRSVTAAGSEDGYWYRRKLELSGVVIESTVP